MPCHEESERASEREGEREIEQRQEIMKEIHVFLRNWALLDHLSKKTAKLIRLS